jgi:hypothetical protein
MRQRFFPSLHLGDFVDAHDALASVGIHGHLADLLVADVIDEGGSPVAYEATMFDDAQDVRTVLVLAPTESGTLSVGYGYLDLAADTEEEAALMAASGIASGVATECFEPPTFLILPVIAPRRVLQ